MVLVVIAMKSNIHQRRFFVFVYQQQLRRANADQPVRVGLIGAGKFGSMFLSQVPTTPGLDVTAIADLDPDRARTACATVGWSSSAMNATGFTDDVAGMLQRDDVDVVVEATGNPLAGVTHARACFAAGKHVVMVNVEADALVGAALAQEAHQAGVVYSMAYGDQPALTCEMVEWARACGFEVVAAGKGTKYLPEYHASTPDTVWDHYGLTAEQAAGAGMNSRMFNSFLDGTKSALEMAAIANATELSAPPDGLAFPPCGMDDLAHVLRPASVGGQLHCKGQVEVVSSLERDGRAVCNDLRWGVYVVIEAPNDYAAACFRQYGMNTDASGRYSAMYKPFHLIGLELNISILSAALLGQPTGSTQGFHADVVATAKRDLRAGETLDGEGGYMVYGKLLPASTSLTRGCLPIGLAEGATLSKAVSRGETICWTDVAALPTSEALDVRRQMEADQVNR
jgi:predicted homoserine dehydrogenase-like protein